MSLNFVGLRPEFILALITTPPGCGFTSVNTLSAIEAGLDVRQKDETTNILLLSHLLFTIVDRECRRIGSTDSDHSDTLKNAAASVSYLDILDISFDLVKHYQNDTKPNPKPHPLKNPFALPLMKDCTCSCHKPGVEMVHCTPCCQ